MRLSVVGCAGSFPGPDSPASCYLVQAEQAGRTWSVLLDLGSGALGPLQRHTDPLALDAVLLTHLHPDHCLDLTGLHVMRTHHPSGQVSGRLPVHAPPGAADRLARAHGVEHGESVEDSFAFVELHDRREVAIGPFRITPYAVRHPVPAFGFRVSAGAVTLAYTGDTDSCDALAPLMSRADLVLAECAFVEDRDTERGVHLTGRRAAEAAVAAGGVRRLMLTHLPAWNDPEVCRAQAAQVWCGRAPVELAEPGLRLEL
ncbi:MAG: MBL fold metallo-hydrolase [Ornithinimicrobium sp.]|uniref:MBL fold metallo-hydrolase n=1 Tax=Ornithinimicrobium sp. TaxID=1977084 RepID=UPI00185C2962|nr:MBL fold metallo-hydrolase [Actinomycetota bacterium]